MLTSQVRVIIIITSHEICRRALLTLEIKIPSEIISMKDLSFIFMKQNASKAQLESWQLK